ncbi:MAG: DUF6616 family protein [Bacteroidota bacterium]
MIYFVEIWNAKPAWKALPTQERADYMNQIGPHIQGLIEKGTQVLTWSVNDPATDQRAAYEFFAIWGFPDQETANGFQGLVQAAGWYNYFEQVNVMGQADSAESVIGTLIQL